jgi:molybdate transport system ATP-binding protein
MSGLAVRLRVERCSTAPFLLDVEFEAPAGITVVCGPSGAGKTTLLLSILGGLKPQAGRVTLGDRTLFDADRGTDLRIRHRRIGMVFQDALLFPHLDALHNVAFGASGPDADSRARDLLERVGAAALATRRPHELSGGQRQRVALVRSLAARPDALLLDEPFSALDLDAREQLGRLLIDLQTDSGIPFLHVTHDLDEAIRLGSALILLDEGRVVQTGPPAAVVARPASAVAARAVGTENRFTGTVARHAPDEGCTAVDLGGTTVQTGLLDLDPGAPVALGLRAEDILCSLDPLQRTSARNVIPGTVRELHPLGTAIELRVATPVSFRVLVTPVSVRELNLHPGATVHLVIKAAAFHRLI